LKFSMYFDIFKCKMFIGNKKLQNKIKMVPCCHGNHQ
jgi:hypothetical protein